MIRKVSGPYNLDTYFLICKTTKKAVIIDPGGPANDMISFIRKLKILPVKILNTHGHADQFFSFETFKKTYPVPSCLHGRDDLFFRDPEVREKTRQAVGLPPPYPADIELVDQEVIFFGNSRLTVIHTPGHTPGSVCFLCEGNLFSGDAIFVGEAGRTDLPGGDLDLLIDSIKTRILPLDKKTIIHPGHHHGDEFESTLEKEIQQNIYITDFILDG
ncbi:MAG: MBL fold metallo-hydrolase [Proteobacteria bacterium]|nr:MBL fold metallo-hydrolase [Pseudomonadota bacterium]MBU1584348.1 MBL fold metallo-hydrolase [Pseudomonadota bacterium]MBU2455761.1 MBL fold metallo-hydrolase [Pseudomonadota bacterium]MBU2627314.1 MBL fold metallo-hydrolase [Pseudomonadota bacterium]